MKERAITKKDTINESNLFCFDRLTDFVTKKNRTNAMPVFQSMPQSLLMVIAYVLILFKIPANIEENGSMALDVYVST